MEKEAFYSPPSEKPALVTEIDKDIVILVHRRVKHHRSFAIALMVAAVLYLCFSVSKPFLSRSGAAHFELTSSIWDQPAETLKPLVPLEAHIMSKCPDAKACLRELVLPTMQRVSPKVNFTLSYIGTPTANDGVECMHGPEECLGNIIELCAAYLYPEPRIYLGFVMCLTRDYGEIPGEEFVQECALEHGIDVDRLNSCSSSDDGFGIAMLRSSIARSREAGVSTSCTIRLNKEIYCVHDGGEWKDCPSGPGVNDLIIAIERLYNSS